MNKKAKAVLKKLKKLAEAKASIEVFLPDESGKPEPFVSNTVDSEEGSDEVFEEAPGPSKPSTSGSTHSKPQPEDQNSNPGPSTPSSAPKGIDENIQVKQIPLTTQVHCAMIGNHKVVLTHVRNRGVLLDMLGESINNKYQASSSFRKLLVVNDKYMDLPVENREAPRGNTARNRVTGAIQMKSRVEEGEIAFQLNGFFDLAAEKQGDRVFGGSEKVFLSYQLPQPFCVVVKDASKFLRRCCKQHNAEVKLVRGAKGMRMLVIAKEKLDKGTEIKIPFDKDWKQSKKELKCVEHERDMRMCKMEKARKKQHEKATAK